MKTPFVFIAMIMVFSLLLAGCGDTEKLIDVTGNWVFKDTTSSATGTMTLKESSDHTTLRGTMDFTGVMKYEFTLTGTIDAKGSINLKGKPSNGSTMIQFSGTVETPTTLKLTAEEEGVVNPDVLQVTKISK